MNQNNQSTNQGFTAQEEKEKASNLYEKNNTSNGDINTGRDDNTRYCDCGVDSDVCNMFMIPQMDKIDVIDVLELIRKRYKAWFQDVSVYKMHIQDDCDKYYFIDLDRHVIIHCTKRFFECKLRKLHSKVVNYKGNLIMICTEKRKFQPEALDFLNSISGFFSKLYDYVGKVSDIGKKCVMLIRDDDLKLVFVDLLAFMMNMRDGYFTFTKVLTSLLTIFTLSTRVRNSISKTFRAQDLSVNDIILGFSVFGVPDVILQRLKTFMALSGKRLHDCTGLVNVVSDCCKVLIDLLDAIVSAHPLLSFMSVISDMCKKVLNYFILHTSMKELVAMHTKYVKNSQVMFDPVYRHEAIKFYEEMSLNLSFMEFIKNPCNRHLAAVWDSFYNNIVKYARSYSSSSRVEPICLVFEGEAHTGKSRLMNAVADVLRKADYSTYVHIVPPVNATKDFYDDYINQDVFIMDDVGQQGVSQWRTIINFVSPVKTPLDCAAQELKNTKFFNSKIIMVTTNALRNLHAFTAADCISTPEALFRRCHVINVTRNSNCEFAQNLKYYKYSLEAHEWQNQYLYEYAACGMPLSVENVSQLNAVKWVFGLVKTMEHLRGVNDNACVINDEDILSIVNNTQVKLKPLEFFDAQITPPDVDRVGHNLWFEDFPESIVNGAEFTAGWVSYITTSMCELALSAWTSTVSGINSVKDWVDSKDNAFLMASIAAAVGVSIVVQYFIQTYMCNLAPMASSESTTKWRDALSSFNAQIADQHKELSSVIPENVLNVQRHIKLLRNVKTGSVGHCLVSGNNLLIPNHYAWDKQYVDIYDTWEHYDHGHKEAEQVQISLVRAFPTIDLAVYKFVDFPVLYKKCRTLFVESNTLDPTVYAVFPGDICKMVRGFNVRENECAVFYDKNGSVTHERNSGYITPLTSTGFCGMVLVDVQGSILSMHVAGNGKEGFTVMPPPCLKEVIRELMLSGFEGKLQVDTKIIDNFSGARLRYEDGEIERKYPIAKTSLVPTPLHRDYCEEMDGIMKDLGIASKGPPIIDRPIAKLKELAMKTFAHQGVIDDEEHNMLHKYMSELIPEFDEISWDLVAFGGEGIPPLNKKSSNGYGFKSNKQDYLDYKNRTIDEELSNKLRDFQRKAENGEDVLEDTLCIETFKDELRVADKRETPRTFRVIPLTHIMWTKKIFGALIKYYKDNIHKTGICVGFNPYKDFDTLARKLKRQKILCDADFKKWDGTLNARIMKIIAKVFSEKYKGPHAEVLHVIMATIINSSVLVNDAVYRTTHGLPSGTWLTLLLNCLYNKALTALTLYRNGGDVFNKNDIIDYVTGDDKICGASTKYEKIFNALTIKSVAESLGMTCTNGDKTPIVSLGTTFDKLNYLKRSFVFNTKLNKWMGALSLDTIINTLQWYDRTKIFDVVMEGKCRAMQVELWLHGYQIYHSIMSVIVKQFPHISLFEEEEIIRILSDDDGYKEVCELSGKDISWW